MARSKFNKAQRAVSSQLARLPRPTVPAAIMKKRLVVAASGTAALMGVALLFASSYQKRPAEVQVRRVTEGTGNLEGYAIVSAPTSTFIVPVSQSDHFQSFIDSDGLAPYVLGRERIDGLRVATAA